MMESVASDGPTRTLLPVHSQNWMQTNTPSIAIAAAAAAAVAEAALVATQAAAEVVRLTSASMAAAVTRTVSFSPPGSSGRDWQQEVAAIKIQSALELTWLVIFSKRGYH